ncbi:hypothetical protein [Bradymonas sediminis]|nr:hypothetical protein [Bradymonas sediminis]
MFTSAVSVSLFACQSDLSQPTESARMESVEVNETALESAEVNETGADSLDELLASMEAVGHGETLRFNSKLEAFLGEPQAIARLQARYQSIPRIEPDLRRRISFLAAQIREPEVINFIKMLALSPPDVWESDDGERRDTAFSVRSNGAIGLAKNYAANVDGAEEAIYEVLVTGDKETARLLALELFSDGNLSSAWRAALESRGISTAFRLLTDAELAKVREVHPEEVRSGEDTRQRPRSTNVPEEGQ